MDRSSSWNADYVPPSRVARMAMPSPRPPSSADAAVTARRAEYGTGESLLPVLPTASPNASKRTSWVMPRSPSDSTVDQLSQSSDTFAPPRRAEMAAARRSDPVRQRSVSGELFVTDTEQAQLAYMEQMYGTINLLNAELKSERRNRAALEASVAARPSTYSAGYSSLDEDVYIPVSDFGEPPIGFVVSQIPVTPSYSPRKLRTMPSPVSRPPQSQHRVARPPVSPRSIVKGQDEELCSTLGKNAELRIRSRDMERTVEKTELELELARKQIKMAERRAENREEKLRALLKEKLNWQKDLKATRAQVVEEKMRHVDLFREFETAKRHFAAELEAIEQELRVAQEENSQLRAHTAEVKTHMNFQARKMEEMAGQAQDEKTRFVAMIEDTRLRFREWKEGEADTLVAAHDQVVRNLKTEYELKMERHQDEKLKLREKVNDLEVSIRLLQKDRTLSPLELSLRKVAILGSKDNAGTIEAEQIEAQSRILELEHVLAHSQEYQLRQESIIKLSEATISRLMQEREVTALENLSLRPFGVEPQLLRGEDLSSDILGYVTARSSPVRCSSPPVTPSRRHQSTININDSSSIRSRRSRTHTPRRAELAASIAEAAAWSSSTNQSANPENTVPTSREQRLMDELTELRKALIEAQTKAEVQSAPPQIDNSSNTDDIAADSGVAEIQSTEATATASEHPTSCDGSVVIDNVETNALSEAMTVGVDIDETLETEDEKLGDEITNGATGSDPIDKSSCQGASEDKDSDIVMNSDVLSTDSETKDEVEISEETCKVLGDDNESNTTKAVDDNEMQDKSDNSSIDATVDTKDEAVPIEISDEIPAEHHQMGIADNFVSLEVEGKDGHTDIKANRLEIDETLTTEPSGTLAGNHYLNPGRDHENFSRRTVSEVPIDTVADSTSAGGVFTAGDADPGVEELNVLADTKALEVPTSVVFSENDMSAHSVETPAASVAKKIIAAVEFTAVVLATSLLKAIDNTPFETDTDIASTSNWSVPISSESECDIVNVVVETDENVVELVTKAFVENFVTELMEMIKFSALPGIKTDVVALVAKSIAENFVKGLMERIGSTTSRNENQELNEIVADESIATTSADELSSFSDNEVASTEDMVGDVAATIDRMTLASDFMDTIESEAMSAALLSLQNERCLNENKAGSELEHEGFESDTTRSIMGSGNASSEEQNETFNESESSENLTSESDNAQDEERFVGPDDDIPATARLGDTTMVTEIAQILHDCVESIENEVVETFAQLLNDEEVVEKQTIAETNDFSSQEIVSGVACLFASQAIAEVLDRLTQTCNREDSSDIIAESEDVSTNGEHVSKQRMRDDMPEVDGVLVADHELVVNPDVRKEDVPSVNNVIVWNAGNTSDINNEDDDKVVAVLLDETVAQVASDEICIEVEDSAQLNTIEPNEVHHSGTTFNSVDEEGNPCTNDTALAGDIPSASQVNSLINPVMEYIVTGIESYNRFEPPGEEVVSADSTSLQDLDSITSLEWTEAKGADTPTKSVESRETPETTDSKSEDTNKHGDIEPFSFASQPGEDECFVRLTLGSLVDAASNDTKPCSTKVTATDVSLVGPDTISSPDTNHEQTLDSERSVVDVYGSVGQTNVQRTRDRARSVHFSSESKEENVDHLKQARRSVLMWKSSIGSACSKEAVESSAKRRASRRRVSRRTLADLLAFPTELTRFTASDTTLLAYDARHEQGQICSLLDESILTINPNGRHIHMDDQDERVGSRIVGKRKTLMQELHSKNLALRQIPRFNYMPMSIKFQWSDFVIATSVRPSNCNIGEGHVVKSPVEPMRLLQKKGAKLPCGSYVIVSAFIRPLEDGNENLRVQIYDGERVEEFQFDFSEDVMKKYHLETTNMESQSLEFLGHLQFRRDEDTIIIKLPEKKAEAGNNSDTDRLQSERTMVGDGEPRKRDPLTYRQKRPASSPSVTSSRGDSEMPSLCELSSPEPSDHPDKAPKGNN